MNINQSEKDKEKSRLYELFSDSKELSNLVPNVVRENYPKVSKNLDYKIDLLSKNTTKYICDAQIDKLASEIIFDREKFFRTLISRLATMPKNNYSPISPYGFLPDNIKVDLTEHGYMSYNNPFGFIAYAKSVNHKNYTLNRDADMLFRKLLDEGRFDSKKTDINILFAGTGILETIWANEINKRNNSNDDNITLIDSSSSASLFRGLLLDKTTSSHTEHIDLDDMCDYISSRMQDDRKCIIIKHNGMSCDNIDDNHRELLLLKSATKFKDATFFYTLPTLNNLTKQEAYITHDPKTIPFAYSTLKELLNVNEKDFSKFEPFVNVRILNADNSITYEIGFKTKEDIEIHNKLYAAIIPEGKALVLQRSNRYSYNSLKGFQKIFGTSRKGVDLEYQLALNSNKSFAALL